jgi:hypothetical protein
MCHSKQSNPLPLSLRQGILFNDSTHRRNEWKALSIYKTEHRGQHILVHQLLQEL